jgi:hypothetical protein
MTTLMILYYILRIVCAVAFGIHFTTEMIFDYKARKSMELCA